MANTAFGQQGLGSFWVGVSAGNLPKDGLDFIVDDFGDFFS